MSIVTDVAVKTKTRPRRHKRWFQPSYIQVLIAVVLGILLGHAKLVLGVYRFISEGGALVNVVGNGIGTIVIGKSENALDVEAYKRQLAISSQDN